ncbi:F0F1 ATP synthase subunit delta [Brachybacterium nesterenkovii]|uniref:ATP synthase subunit delta n=1 Tax=Brachybacterium nesterenkovii TaxID=47847 RepID=A0A1X6X4R3_9MICO|nr:F0F1 ATP synthase subunit delta [Brachybacterium nesterenkovii]SLM93901.1 ATP synthase delta chain [Brachybacterium nesterenkovii]
MRGTSAASLREVVEAAEHTFRTADAPLEQTADELFSALEVIDGSNQLLRLLSDGGLPASVKQQAARELFGSRIGQAALSVVLDVVGRRWSEQEDVLDALERVGVVALLEQASRSGSLERVEEELFQVSRLIDATPELSEAFDDARERPAERAGVLGRLLSGRVDPITLSLATQAVARRSEAKPSRRVLELAEYASERRGRLLAVVTSARPLTEQQSARLGAILDRIYGRPVQMNVEVSSDVVGGLRIQVGDDLYDATVLSRLAQARERLAS